MSSQRHRKRGPALLAVVVLALGMAACGSSPAKVRRVATTTSRSTTSSTTSTSAAPTTTSVPRPQLPAGGPVPSGFEPESVTFISATTGFVLGVDATCPAGSCAALARTSDTGASWVALPAPPAAYENRFATGASKPAVSEVRFADALDGWIYGPSLFVTHDGGASWQQLNLGGPVVDLETSGGFVDAVVSPCGGQETCSGSLRLEQALTTGSAFTTVLSGPAVQAAAGALAALSLHAPVGFVNLSGASGISPAALYATRSLAVPSGWNAFPDPCTVSADYSLDAFVAPDVTSLYSLCGGPGAAGSVAKEVVRTENGHSTVVGQPPPGGDPEGLAATSSGTLVVSAASGASELYRSADGGATWTTAVTFSDGGIGFNDLGFTTSTQGVVIHGEPGPPTDFVSQLLMTKDGGANWQVVPIA
ncbi:MAG TPA: hypothetical protein VEG62_07540 [Acidimicrobiales bacterium]|nr:hypothetical protein [Acidimicrobiales bacterium]